MAQSKQKLAILFGGTTVEHEVSVLTGIQLLNNANTEQYDLFPVYVDKKGAWWTGEQLFNVDFFKTLDLEKPKGLEPFNIIAQPNSNDIDVALLCFHGKYGEAGNVQGLLELADIPYQGPAVASSAVCFDKILLRHVLQAGNIPQPDFVWFTKKEWQQNRQQVEQKIDSLTLESPELMIGTNLKVHSMMFLSMTIVF